MEQASRQEARAGSSPAPKVLICTVDGGWFGVRADWVEAVCPRGSVVEQSIRASGRPPQPFIIFQGAPALVAELRTLVGLDAVAGSAEREQYMLVRSGSFVVAVPIDQCIGIRSIDLHGRTPVPSRIVRDGGMPIGHVVELDGRMLVVLDPARLLDAAGRSLWKTAVRRAEAQKRRQAKIDSLWTEICSDPSAAAIRSYASLCSRAGRGSAAAAARALLAHLPDENGAGRAGGEDVIRELLTLAEQKRTGRLVVDGNGSGEANLELIAGRVIDVRHADRQGRAAVEDLLATPARPSRFIESDPPSHAPEEGGTSAAALLIETLEAGSRNRRKRRS